MSKKSEQYGAIAEAFENLGIAFRALEGTEENQDTKSPNAAGDAVASGAGKPGRPKGNAAPAVDTKPAGKPKGKPPAAPTVTYDALRAKLTELMTLKGKEVAKEILNGFGVNLLKELNESDYAEANSQAIAALAADDEVVTEDEDNMFGD